MLWQEHFSHLKSTMESLIQTFQVPMWKLSDFYQSINSLRITIQLRVLMLRKLFPGNKYL